MRQRIRPSCVGWPAFAYLWLAMIVAVETTNPSSRLPATLQPALLLPILYTVMTSSFPTDRLTTRFAGEDGSPGGPDDDTEIGIATKTRAKPKKPSQYKVLLLNDDYTPMEFVVIVLKRFFRMNIDEATQVMLHVHQKGVGICGVYPYEVAETKVNQVMDFAKQNQHPLQCTLEKA